MLPLVLMSLTLFDFLPARLQSGCGQATVPPVQPPAAAAAVGRIITTSTQTGRTRSQAVPATPALLVSGVGCCCCCLFGRFVHVCPMSAGSTQQRGQGLQWEHCLVRQQLEWRGSQTQAAAVWCAQAAGSGGSEQRGTAHATLVRRCISAWPCCWLEEGWRLSTPTLLYGRLETGG